MIVRIIQSLAVAALLTVNVAPAQTIDAAKQMKRDVGDWNLVIKMFGAPGAAPAISKGTETRFMLGDMWLIGHFKGQIMGASFAGLRQTGFDPQKNKFVASWVDSTSRYPTQMEGTWDAKTSTMTWIGTGKSPSGSEMRAKIVVAYNEDGSHISTMYAMRNGQEMKMMEFHYTKIDDQPAKSER
jgi:hypothetical protein